MTTIAYRDGILAADSRISGGPTGMIYPEKARKLFVSQKHRCVIGFSGQLLRAVEFVRIIDSLDEAPWDSGAMIQIEGSEDQEGPNFTTLVACADGRLLYGEATRWVELNTEFASLGSGAQASNAAMYMGADAETAVRVASKCDASTDDNVIALKIADQFPSVRKSASRAAAPAAKRPRARSSATRRSAPGKLRSRRKAGHAGACSARRLPS